MFLGMQIFDFAQSDSINLQEDVAVSPASTALIESIIQINKVYKCAFLSMKMLLKLKLSGLRPRPRWGAFSAPSNPP